MHSSGPAAKQGSIHVSDNERKRTNGNKISYLDFSGSWGCGTQDKSIMKTNLTIRLNTTKPEHTDIRLRQPRRSLSLSGQHSSTAHLTIRLPTAGSTKRVKSFLDHQHQHFMMPFPQTASCAWRELPCSPAPIQKICCCTNYSTSPETAPRVPTNYI